MRALALACVLVACGGGGGADAAVAPRDAPRDVVVDAFECAGDLPYDHEIPLATRAPAGEGWCCHRGSKVNSASECPGTGGWVADRCECGRDSPVGAHGHWCDVPSCAYTDDTDEHGCERWLVMVPATCAGP